MDIPSKSKAVQDFFQLDFGCDITFHSPDTIALPGSFPIRRYEQRREKSSPRFERPTLIAHSLTVARGRIDGEGVPKHCLSGFSIELHSHVYTT
jgi:hypothetical protein